jgi:metal-responsive CopG/Arc/MetJ family transcriptional regulator
LVQVWQASDAEVFGIVTLVYNHDVRQLSDRLTELQHKYQPSCRLYMFIWTTTIALM